MIAQLTNYLYHPNPAIPELVMFWRIPQIRNLSPAARLRREVLLALALKGALLLAVYLLFFSPAHRPPSNAAATSAALIETSVPRDMR